MKRLEMLRLKKSLSRGCGTVVERTPHDQEFFGSNPAVRGAFLFSYSFYLTGQ